MIDSLYEEGKIRFIKRFATRTGRHVAKRLGLEGKGSEIIISLVSSFFWNLAAAISVEKFNKKVFNKQCNVYVTICKNIHEDIVNHAQFVNLPEWIKQDLRTSAKFINLSDI